MKEFGRFLPEVFVRGFKLNWLVLQSIETSTITFSSPFSRYRTKEYGLCSESREGTLINSLTKLNSLRNVKKTEVGEHGKWRWWLETRLMCLEVNEGGHVGLSRGVEVWRCLCPSTWRQSDPTTWSTPLPREGVESRVECTKVIMVGPRDEGWPGR